MINKSLIFVHQWDGFSWKSCDFFFAENSSEKRREVLRKCACPESPLNEYFINGDTSVLYWGKQMQTKRITLLSHNESRTFEHKT